jgi:hypothetical protein
MYPLNMQLPSPAVGFALASDAAEHQTLTDAGYLPAFVPAEPAKPSKAK